MRYVSLFSGIEAASAAWGPLGWEPVSFSEIDPFPSAVLARRFPGVPNLGDITKIDWSKHGECATADLVVGGSPCQSFSIAGARTGLDGASGLMWEYVRAVRELRPRWVVWENVPGALSSSDGRDFGCLLGALDDLGYGLAWRVLDAQFFGVAQRRRRLFLVGSLGDQRASEVLFEPESLRWDHPSSRAKRQALAGQSQGRTGSAGDGGGRLTLWGEKDRNGGGDVLCATDTGSNSSIAEDLAPTLTAHEGKAASYVTVNDTWTNRHANAELRAYTLQIRAGKEGGGKGALVQDDMSATLTVAQTQTLFPGDGTVRRLTPTECERLQGFEDGWTDVPYRGAEHAPDSPRYKALGNSMAVPVMRWIGQRIQHVEEVPHDVD